LSESHSRDVLLTIFSLAVFFSLISSGSLAVFTDRPSMITSVGASSDGSSDEGGGEQGGEGQTGDEPEETTPPEPDIETDDDQQIPTPETSPPFAGKLRGDLTPEDQTPQSICIINPSDPQCQPKPPTPPTIGEEGPTPAPTTTPPTTPSTFPPLLNLPSKTPLSLCIINPSHPDCQKTPATTLGSQSPTPDFTRALTPTPILTPTPTPNSGNTGVGQARPESNTGDLFASPFSSELQTELPNTALTQRAPDTLFSGPKSAPGGGGVPLRDPVLVPAPSEEGTSEEPCVTLCPPYEYDEICRNGKDDDFDGKVDEAYPCREVPGESKPRTPDGVLTEIPGSPLGPPQN
jgi:hypothetical protein